MFQKARDSKRRLYTIVGRKRSGAKSIAGDACSFVSTLDGDSGASMACEIRYLGDTYSICNQARQ